MSTFTQDVEFDIKLLRKVKGPGDFTIKAISRRHKVVVTFDDVPGNSSLKVARVTGSSLDGVMAMVAAIRELTGHLPLLSGVPVPQELYDRLARNREPEKSDPEASDRLRAVGSYCGGTAFAAAAAELRARTAAHASSGGASAGPEDFPNPEEPDADGEVNTVTVSNWNEQQVRDWARACAGCSEEDSAHVTLNGAALLRFPLYPTMQLEEALQESGMTPEGAAQVATAYMEQRWQPSQDSATEMAKTDSKADH